MKLSLSICAATSLLQTVVAGNYDFLYYTDLGCNSRAFGCRAIDPWVCCGSPPSASNYKTVKTNGGSASAVVLFTYDVDGHCGNCQSTAILGKCYLNYPFSNGVIIAVSNPCQAWNAKLLAADDGGGVRCNGKAALNFASVNGVNYTLPQGVEDEIGKDLVDLGDEEFGIKWAHLRDD
ncbi:hypothetical protein ISF_04390 [Cordyceps fumosorosea ARSEF 2679]|uniref:Uncharacterized protein n=1 Tax=Cordyceps fumosorosea (strain ARSEF 2679) TaxID=1081104 RepID=A0A162MPR1_CORFA|nr:hypothetical protein ISF_04390 [Cordyceps fumosorosea ARSEF 2679]OAA64980.1 hypothetical protein ISF_04390 [Cordyceps fumosorosea ARSEF 2679]